MNLKSIHTSHSIWQQKSQKDKTNKYLFIASIQFLLFLPLIWWEVSLLFDWVAPLVQAGCRWLSLPGHCICWVTQDQEDWEEGPAAPCLPVSLLLGYHLGSWTGSHHLCYDISVNGLNVRNSSTLLELVETWNMGAFFWTRGILTLISL